MFIKPALAAMLQDMPVNTLHVNFWSPTDVIFAPQVVGLPTRLTSRTCHQGKIDQMDISFRSETDEQIFSDISIFIKKNIQQSIIIFKVKMEIGIVIKDIQ